MGFDHNDLLQEKGPGAVRDNLDAAKLFRPAAQTLIRPILFKWIDPAQIQPRKWLYGRHYIRQFASATIAASKGGKTSLIIAEALAMVTGRPLLNVTPTQKCRVWLWNGEDPIDELQRRVTAAMLALGVFPHEVEGRLFFNSGRDTPIILASQTKAGTVIAEPVEEELTAQLSSLEIDVLSIDPFVSCHRVPENDNNAIDAVAKTWGRIAGKANCAIDLSHHIRKANGQTELTADDARGGSGFIATVRCARGLNRMTKEQAEQAGVDDRKSYFCVADVGGNLAPPSEEADWYHFENVRLANGDNVGAAVKWKWPSAFQEMAPADLLAVQKRIAAGEWRESEKAADWAGQAVADVLGLDLNSPAARRDIRTMLKTWIANGALKEVNRRDEKRMMRKWIETGEWAA